MRKTNAAIIRDDGGGGVCDHGDDVCGRGGHDVRGDDRDGDGGDARDDVACRDDDRRP